MFIVKKFSHVSKTTNEQVLLATALLFKVKLETKYPSIGKTRKLLTVCTDIEKSCKSNAGGEKQGVNYKFCRIAFI